MTVETRLMLLVGAVFTLFYFVHHIRKNRMQIDYAIYWALFSGALVVLSIFPQIANVFSKLLGVQSPANLVYLVIIFLLIIKLFTSTMKISRLNQQLTELVQHIALREMERPESVQAERKE